MLELLFLLFYVADVIGYTGSISVQIYEDLFVGDKAGMLVFLGL